MTAPGIDGALMNALLTTIQKHSETSGWLAASYPAAVQFAAVLAAYPDLAADLGQVLTEHTAPGQPPEWPATLRALAAASDPGGPVLPKPSERPHLADLRALGFLVAEDDGRFTVTAAGLNWLDAHPRTEGGDAS